MKSSKLRYICAIIGILGLILTGCGTQSVNDTTQFQIPANRPYQTDITEEPEIASSFTQGLVVIPWKQAVNSQVSTKLCINTTTQEVLTEENPFKQIYPASITKIMTALLVLENGNLEDMVTIDTPIVLNDPMAVSIGLQAGDTLTVNELMHGMLITSANDCAVALGRYVSGSEDAFIELMNQRATELGATHTHFVNTNGLHDSQHYTTGYDLYLIFKELIKHPEFLDIAGTANYTMSFQTAEGTKSIPIVNSNQFISGGYEAPEGITVVSGKTGTTNEAGCCLILEAIDDENQVYIAVVCGADNRKLLYSQMEELLQQMGSK